MENKKKKVTICASGTFVEKAKYWQKLLEENNYKIIAIPKNLKGDYEDVHRTHYRKISKSDILLILNFKKNNINNYIGPSVFAEIAFAIGLNLSFKKRIKIFLLNPIPKNLPYSKELLLWRKLGWLKRWEKI